MITPYPGAPSDFALAHTLDRQCFLYGIVQLPVLPIWCCCCAPLLCATAARCCCVLQVCTSTPRRPDAAPGRQKRRPGTRVTQCWTQTAALRPAACLKPGAVAQLDSASVYGAGGWRFEPSQHQLLPPRVASQPLQAGTMFPNKQNTRSRGTDCGQVASGASIILCGLQLPATKQLAEH